MVSKNQSVCNPSVFEGIYKEHVGSLRNYLYYKCGDADLAEDLVQDSFMKIWRDCAKILPKTVKALLYKMSYNALMSVFSHKKVVLAHEKLANPASITHEDPEFIMEEKEFLVKLQRAITELPDKDREVFLMNRIDKKKYKEIAEILEISIKTVEKRMSSALRALRMKIEHI